MPLGYGVIGSPTDSGSVSLGSSPGTPAKRRVLGLNFARAPLCSGLARRPLKAVARVRIPSGLQKISTLRGGFFVPHDKSGQHLFARFGETKSSHQKISTLRGGDFFIDVRDILRNAKLPPQQA